MAAILGAMLGEGEERRENMKAITIIVVLFCFGCASTGSGNQKIMDASFMDSIQVGVTTKGEVLSLLGLPMSLFDPIWTYQGDDRIISPLWYVPLIDLVARQTVRSRLVEIYFNQGVVSDVKVESGSEKRMYAAGTVSLIFAGLGAVAGAGSTPYAPYTAGGRSYPGRAVINTVPTTGGGSAGIDKVYRDMILGHSLRGMDIQYMSPSEDDLHRAMAKYTEWLDSQLNLQSVDHNVD